MSISTTIGWALYCISHPTENPGKRNTVIARLPTLGVETPNPPNTTHFVRLPSRPLFLLFRSNYSPCPCPLITIYLILLLHYAPYSDYSGRLTPIWLAGSIHPIPTCFVRLLLIHCYPDYVGLVTLVSGDATVT